MSGKIILSVVCLMLVVSVGTAVDPVIEQPSQKIIGVICKNAGEDQKLCEETLQPVTGLDAANPKAYIEKLVKSMDDSITKGMNMSDDIINTNKDGIVVNTLSCYKESLKPAMSSVSRCVNLVSKNDIQQIVNQNSDLTSWLSAAYSYLSTSECFVFDVVTPTEEEGKIFEKVTSETLVFVKKYITMCLNIATALPQIVQELMPLI